MFQGKVRGQHEFIFTCSATHMANRKKKIWKITPPNFSPECAIVVGARGGLTTKMKYTGRRVTRPLVSRRTCATVYFRLPRFARHGSMAHAGGLTPSKLKIKRAQSTLSIRARHRPSYFLTPYEQTVINQRRPPRSVDPAPYNAVISRVVFLFKFIFNLVNFQKQKKPPSSRRCLSLSRPPPPLLMRYN